MNPPSPASVAGNGSATATRPRVLVVDDDEFVRRMNCQILMIAGCDVDEAEDGSVAWDHLQLQGYDLLITDNQMPKVSGVELVQKIRDAGVVMPVVMATGTLPGNGFAQSHANCPVTPLLKPYGHAELLATVKAVLHSGLMHCEPAPMPHLESRPSSLDVRFC